MSRIEKILQAIIDGTSYSEAPQSRIEEILLAIKNDTDYLESQYSRIEEILLAIKNETSCDKEPMSRIEEILMAKLHNEEYTKLPESRIEELLIEWLMATAYKELEGVPPLVYKAIEGTLKNYRIYGNTVDGESVGDRTGNLFDGIYPNIKIPVTYRAIYVGTGIFTLSGDIPIFFDTANLFLLTGNVSDGASSQVNGVGYGVPRSAESIDGYITIGYRNYYDVDPRDYNIMLNVGSTPLPYEPYGYKVPVTVSNGTDTQTTPIYLPEQIKMVGDEAEYIDYAEQKQHRVRKNLWSGIVEQGSVSTIGEYANDSSRIRSKNISLSPGTYTISCNLGIRCIYAYNNSEKVSLVVDNGGGAVYRNTFTIPSGANNVSISLRAFNANGTPINNITPSDFEWGQIEKGSEATTYEPYITNTELDVTLPALPTLSDTNILTVGTEVKPSKVYVKYKGG